MIKRLVKVSLPSEYQRVEYLEGDGNSYIDTNIIPNDNFGFEVNFKYIEFVNNEVFGCGVNYNDGLGMCTHGTSDICFVKGNDYENRFKDFLNYHTYLLKSNGDAYIDGTFISNNAKSIRTNNRSFLLFCMDKGSITPQKQSYKYFKMFDSNTVVMHLIPCYRKADNVAGMYDIISNTFFTNAGSGEFIVGNKFVDNKTETVVTNRDRSNIDTITESTTIEYCEKEHIDYDGSELTKEITITRPCKLYLGFECKNSEQIIGGTVPMPYSLNYEIKIGNTIYDSGKPNATKIGGDFEYVLLDITEDMLPYTTTISIYVHMYPNHPLADLEQVIHLYSDIYYTVGEIEVMKKIKAIKRYVGGELKDITKINKIVNGEVKTINI